MYDKSLKLKELSPPLIIKDFVIGEENCNYEKYLLEFINASKYFLLKSNGKSYFSPSSEANGECDCISSNYEIDFKLFASKTLLQGRSTLSRQVQVICPGLTSDIPPKNTNGSIIATQIHVALRDCTLDVLHDIRRLTPKTQGEKNDILHLLKVLETKKNLFLFFPYNFSFDAYYEINVGLNQIISAVQSDFKYIMQYRTHKVPYHDTYFAFMYHNCINITKVENADFIFIESIETNKSSTYVTLSKYCSI